MGILQVGDRCFANHSVAYEYTANQYCDRDRQNPQTPEHRVGVSKSLRPPHEVIDRPVPGGVCHSEQQAARESTYMGEIVYARHYEADSQVDGGQKEQSDQGLSSYFAQQVPIREKERDKRPQYSEYCAARADAYRVRGGAKIECVAGDAASQPGKDVDDEKAGVTVQPLDLVSER